MRIRLCQVDAFAAEPLMGNPAAVCLLDGWPSAEVMLNVAGENNLSETAFVRRRADGDWDLRWFTPTVEVELCGHATLGAAAALRHWGETEGSVRFHTASGVLTVDADGDRLVMDFPAMPVRRELHDPDLTAALGLPVRGLHEIRALHRARYVLAEVASETAVRQATPDIAALGAVKTNVIVTAPGDEVDVVSRFFAPASGVAEDPVTGSAHCTLAVFWANRFGRNKLHCRQISHRPGDVWTEVIGDRVRLAGRASLFFDGWAELPPS